MAEQYTKNQHQHPRVSLRLFADKPTREGRVWVFDKETMRSSHRSPNSIASGEFFYDLPEDEELHPARPQRVEKALGRYESLYAGLSRDLVNSLDDLAATWPWNIRPSIKDDQREALADYLSMQILRTNEFRTSQRQMIMGHVASVNRILGHYREGFARKLGVSESELPPLEVHAEGQIFDDKIPEYEEDLASVYQAQSMFGDIQKRLTNTLLSHIWSFAFNDTAHSFYTSDNPVVKYKHDKSRWWSSGGWRSRGIQVVFPLSPRYLVMLYEREFFDYWAPYEDRLFPFHDEHVRFYNSLQVTESYAQVCCRDDDFDLAREICDRHPDVRSADRPRWASAQVGAQSDQGASD